MKQAVVVSNEQITTFLRTHPDWRFESDRLIALFSLRDFSTAMKVVHGVARAAEELRHHPYWCNDYNKLTFTLTTHDVGSKVTNRDLELADAIDRIVEVFAK